MRDEKKRVMQAIGTGDKRSGLVQLQQQMAMLERDAEKVQEAEELLKENPLGSSALEEDFTF